jgi:hypothetical protein
MHGQNLRCAEVTSTVESLSGEGSTVWDPSMVASAEIVPLLLLSLLPFTATLRAHSLQCRMRLGECALADADEDEDEALDVLVAAVQPNKAAIAALGSVLSSFRKDCTTSRERPVFKVFSSLSTSSSESGCFVPNLNSVGKDTALSTSSRRSCCGGAEICKRYSSAANGISS